MFSLIITIISIALVVTLLAATMYNGGDTLTEAKAQADATRLKNQEQQILAAVDFFQAEHNRFPEDLAELVSAGFLRSIPAGVAADADVAAVSLIHSAHAHGSGWTTPTLGLPVFITAKNVPQLTCSKFNLASRGDDGILRAPYDSLRSQCFGEDGTYSVVIYKSGSVNLVDALAGVPVQSGSIPPVTDGGWAQQPTNGGQGQTPGTTDPEPEPEPELSVAVLTSSNQVNLTGWLGQGTLQTTALYRNDGNAPMTLTPGAAFPVELTLLSNTCTAVAPNDSCSIQLQVDNGYMHQTSYSLAVVGADTNPAAVDISWKVSATIARWSSGSLDMGTSQIGVPVTRTINLFNDGNEVANWSRSVTGNLPAQFVLDTSACVSVQAGSSCSVAVTFTPAAETSYAASDVAMTGATVVTNTLSISGVGQPKLITADQIGYTMTQGMVGHNMYMTSVRLTNNSGQNIPIGTATVNGTAKPYWSNRNWGPGEVLQFDEVNVSQMNIRIIFNNGQVLRTELLYNNKWFE